MNARRILLVIVVVAAGGTAATMLLPLGRWLVELAALGRSTGLAGIALFIAAYIVSTIAFIPGSVLTLGAGFAYGPWWGLLLASPASVAAATCAFLLGRTLLRDWASTRMGNSPRALAVDRAVEREGFKLVLLLRLSPLFPFTVLNYVLSLSRVSLRTYVVASFVGMLPGTLFYAYMGSLLSTAAELTSGLSTRGPARTAMYAGGFAATIAVVVIGARTARRALAAELVNAASLVEASHDRT